MALIFFWTTLAAFLPDCLRFAIIHNVNMAGIENYSLIRLLAERRLIPSECHTHRLTVPLGFLHRFKVTHMAEISID